jgi:hypothetical protein
MPSSVAARAISVVAKFPPGYFLENIIALPDNTLLATVANRKCLYSIPPPTELGQSRVPVLLDQFPDDQWAFGIVAAPQNPGLAYVLTTDFTSQGSCTHYLRLLDLSNVAKACHLTILMQFPSTAKGLNWLVALSDSVLLAADSFAGCIWRIDLKLDKRGIPTSAEATEWLRDRSLDGKLVLPDFQPGVNGLKYSYVANALCFSSTQQRLFARVSVDPQTLQPVGPVLILATGAQGDDLIIDDHYEGGPVAYLTTHRDNTILRIPIAPPGLNSSGDLGTHVETVAEGSVQDPRVLGPTAGAWK